MHPLGWSVQYSARWRRVSIFQDLLGCKCGSLLWFPFWSPVWVAVTEQYLLPDLWLCFSPERGGGPGSPHCSAASPVVEVSLGAVGNSGLVRLTLPCPASFAPHDPLLAGVGRRALFKALKLELNSCSAVLPPFPQGFNCLGAQVEVGAGLCPWAA